MAPPVIVSATLDGHETTAVPGSKGWQFYAISAIGGVAVTGRRCKTN
jgi:hypothetical protein